jgi:predicted glycosyltransferase
MVDSPVAPFFDLSPRIDYIKLPTIVKVDAGVFRPGRLQAEYARVNKIRSAMISEVLRHFQPEVMLVDHMPGGANNELLPSLEMAYREKLFTKFVLGLRDIIDDPSVTCGLWERERVYETMEKYYSDILIYSSPDFFPTAEKYNIPETERKKVHYCGYVSHLARPSTEIKEESGIPVVSLLAGGGADGYRLMSAFLDSLEEGPFGQSVSSVIVTGPFLPEEHSKTVRDRSNRLGVRVHATLKDTFSHINASDVIVSMAGYNTLSEILTLGKAAVIVPRPGPSKEQTMRAAIFSERGLIRYLPPQELTGASLRAAIMDMLKMPKAQNSVKLPDMNGVANATGILLSLFP